VYREFVEAFAHKLYAINDTSRMVLIEEAPELVPQRLRPDMTGVFEAVERLVSRGRNRGIGVTLISQRAATINKDVLTQIDALFVFGVTSPQDRKALHEWVEAKAEVTLLKEFEAGIAGLQKQEAWVWAPSAFKEGGIFQKVRIRNFTTFHPDKTHLRRRGLLAQKPVMTDVPKIVEKLSGELAHLAKEKVDLKDVPKLHARIRQLEKDNQLMHAQLPLRLKHEPVADIKGMIKRAVDESRAPMVKEMTRLNLEIRMLRAFPAKIKRAVAILTPLIAEMPDLKASGFDIDRSVNPPCIRPTVQVCEPTPRVIHGTAIINRKRTDYEVLAPEGDVHLKSGAVRMLKELASKHPIGLTKGQLAAHTGFSMSGGAYSSYLSNLRRAGLIEEDQKGNLRASEAGMAYMGETPAEPVTHEEVMAMWQRNLKSGCYRILETLVDAYPDEISYDDLAVTAGMASSGGGFGSYLSVLRRNGLIETHDHVARATEAIIQ
jgi:hypothetical protein